MKLFSILTIVAVLYIAGMVHMVKELKQCTNADERRSLQTIPMMGAMTFLFLSVTATTIRLTLQGVYYFL